MRIDDLRQLADRCKTNPHYRLRGVPDIEFMLQAKKSFSKLSAAQQQKVQKSWAEAVKRDGKELTPEIARWAIEFRFLAQTNLFFLCHLLEKYRDMTLGSHEEICNDFFVQKDPAHLTFKQFADDYSGLKRRQLLTPRGGFKSSIDIADCVQYIICWPQITILILTGVLQLAKDFVGELRGHFTLEQDTTVATDPDDKKKVPFGPRKLMNQKTGEWSDSLFQVLFAEHCIRDADGRETEFQTPAGREERQPTVRAASIEQSLSGMHFGVLKLDDVVTNENSLTVSRLEGINKQISINEAMLHPYGFFDVIGTWYHEQDYYGVTIKQEDELAKERGMPESIRGSVDSGRYNSEVSVKIYLRAAWWPTEAATKAGKIETEMTKEDWELWCPEILSYEVLMEKRRDPYFAIKYLNNPRKMDRVKFPRELLLRRTIPHTQLPPQGIVVTTIDTAYSTKSWADYTVILTSLIYGGRFYIINMVRGRFNEFELPAIIAASAYKWKPKSIAIEESVGVKWMGRELRREMDKLSISVPVQYVSLGLGSKSKSKHMKAKPVMRLLGDERMFFLNSCEGLQDIYNEMEKFTGTADDTHDDIVSALSILADVFGAYADMDAKVNFASTQYVADRQSREHHDMIYGLGKYARFRSVVDDNPVTQFQIAQQGDMPIADSDPLGDLFG